MKIALCLSGQPRFLERGYEQLLRHIISKYDVDVFFHSWFNAELTNTKFSYTIHYPNRNEKWRSNLDQIMLDLYSPKLHLFESPKEFWFDSNANFELGNTNNCSMFYSIQKSNELKIEYERIHKFKYDLVIRARTDVLFYNFNLDLNNLDSSSVNVLWTGYNLEDGTKIVNDQFAIGGSGVMDAYSSVYNFYNFYWKRDKPSSMTGERVLTRHLVNCKVPLNIYNSDVLHNCIHLND